jgi:hypothetical protein
VNVFVKAGRCGIEVKQFWNKKEQLGESEIPPDWNICKSFTIYIHVPTDKVVIRGALLFLGERGSCLSTYIPTWSLFIRT